MVNGDEPPGDEPPPSTPPRIQRRSKRVKQYSPEEVTMSLSKADLNAGKPSAKRSSLSQTPAFSTPLRENPSTKQKSINTATNNTMIKVTSVNLVKNKAHGDWYSAIFVISYTNKFSTRSLVKTSMAHWQSQDYSLVMNKARDIICLKHEKNNELDNVLMDRGT